MLMLPPMNTVFDRGSLREHPPIIAVVGIAGPALLAVTRYLIGTFAIASGTDVATPLSGAFALPAFLGDPACVTTLTASREQ